MKLISNAARVACALVLGAVPLAYAQTGAVGHTILIGQSGEFSGQGVAKENTDGARAYFAYVNKSGGIHGRKIELRSYDDGRVIKKTIENTEKLINEDKVFALFGYRSTPSVVAALPVLTKAGVPLVAPFSGALAIREPLNPLVFHLRASYQQEAGKIITHLATQGTTRIAILYQDDEFGKDGLAGFQKHLGVWKITPPAVAKYDRKTLDIDEAVKAMAKVTPEAVVMACTPKACVNFVKKMKSLGLQPQFFTLSNVNSDEFVKALGEQGRGVGVAQVVPYPWRASSPLVREFQQVLRDLPAADAPPISYSSFEGFVAAKLLVDGLRRAGPNLTRTNFAAAMEGLQEHDLGGMFIRFSGADHTGSDFVELTMISRDGKYIR
jgi:ABC-type branched-subunit amino acid transport system substrate-binding protein